MAAADPDVSGAAPSESGFAVHLDVFEGPFDLLLSLIARRRLDVTLIALSQVTDDFIAYIRAADGQWDLDQASEFLVVAATLLDLKLARLLPSLVEEDEEDLALLEARDLLFARLLQYRAFREIADWLRERLAAAATRWPRSVALEPQFAQLRPVVVIGVSPTQLAQIYRQAQVPRPAPVVDIGHVHAPAVSVREQALLLAERLAAAGAASFRQLVRDQPTMIVVARFLAVLELYREGLIHFDQAEPLSDLQVRWVGGEAPESLPDVAGVEDQPESALAGNSQLESEA